MATANDAQRTAEADDYSDLLQTPYSDAFAFSDAEQLALDLYDKLGELALEKSLLDALADGKYQLFQSCGMEE